jgi:nucleoside-diphosphate-sugar epimerase
MKFLVTGGAGRLGTELVKLFASGGHGVVAFDLPGAFWDTVKSLDEVESVIGDVTDPDVVKGVSGDVDVVVHLAALLPPRSEGNRELTLRVNVEGTRNIVEALKDTGGAMVFASSISTYGITGGEEPPVDELRPLRMHNIYSESKIWAEGIIADSKIPHSILRVAPVAVVDLLEPPEVVPYRADQRVEFITVPDAALALYNVATAPEAIGKTLNIAGGESWQMTGREYLEGFYGALGVEVELNFSEEYTALDWYDTSKSLFLGYQKTSFNEFQRKLGLVAEELGLI